MYFYKLGANVRKSTEKINGKEQNNTYFTYCNLLHKNSPKYTVNSRLAKSNRHREKPMATIL
jgi:hypothetical protein